MVSNRKNNPSFFQSILPIFFLVVLLAINVSIFKGDSLSGSIQIVLFLSSAFATIIAFIVGFSWNEIQEGIVKSIKSGYALGVGIIDAFVNVIVLFTPCSFVTFIIKFSKVRT